MFQPADVGLQRYLKHHVKRSATDFFVASATRDLNNNIPVDQIKLPTDLPSLRNASIGWLLDAYKFFTDNRDIVKNAWAQSKIAGLNLTWESMKSDAALENLNKLRKSDLVFDAEFAKFDLNGLSAVSGDLDSEGEVTLGADCDFGDDDISLTTQELIVQCSDPNSAQLESVAHNDFIPVEPAEEPREWGFYPQDIAIKGGTHYAYYQTHEEGRVTDKKAPKKNAKGTGGGKEKARKGKGKGGGDINGKGGEEGAGTKAGKRKSKEDTGEIPKQKRSRK